MGKENRRKLFQLAESQQGYFIAYQAEECGYSRSNFHRLLKSGEWVKEIRGIYRLAQYPIQDRPELVLWALWSRNKKGEPQGVWSHETALDIHELTDVMPAKMHMTVPRECLSEQVFKTNKLRCIKLQNHDATFHKCSKNPTILLNSTLCNSSPVFVE